MPIEPSVMEVNWQAIGLVLSILSAALGGIWAVGKLLMWQFNRSLQVQFDSVSAQLQLQTQEFGDIKRRLEKQEDNDLHLERQLSALREELPRDYVRREDFTRVIASFEVKVDNLRLTIERLLFSKGSN
jgi:hypothetical protein